MEVNARTLTRYSKTRNICIEEFIPLTADDSTLSRYSSIIKDYYEDSVPLTADDVRKRALLLNVDATEKPLRADVEEEALRRQLVGYVVVPWQNISDYFPTLPSPAIMPFQRLCAGSQLVDRMSGESEYDLYQRFTLREFAIIIPYFENRKDNGKLDTHERFLEHILLCTEHIKSIMDWSRLSSFYKARATALIIKHVYLKSKYPDHLSNNQYKARISRCLSHWKYNLERRMMTARKYHVFGAAMLLDPAWAFGQNLLPEDVCLFEYITLAHDLLNASPPFTRNQVKSRRETSALLLFKIVGALTYPAIQSHVQQFWMANSMQWPSHVYQKLLGVDSLLRPTVLGMFGIPV